MKWLTLVQIRAVVIINYSKHILVKLIIQFIKYQIVKTAQSEVSDSIWHL